MRCCSPIRAPIRSIVTNSAQSGFKFRYHTAAISRVYWYIGSLTYFPSASSHYTYIILLIIPHDVHNIIDQDDYTA
jgi:hypothetical protein